MTGTIKSILIERHFGFIQADDGTEVFLHRDTLAPGVRLADLQRGDRVTFARIEGPRGPRAEGVRRVEAGRRRA